MHKIFVVLLGASVLAGCQKDIDGPDAGITRACTSAYTVNNGATSVTYHYAVVDVGGPRSDVRVLMCEPTAPIEIVPSACPNGQMCNGEPAPLQGCTAVTGGRFTAGGQLIVVCGTTTNGTASYYRSFTVE